MVWGDRGRDLPYGSIFRPNVVKAEPQRIKQEQKISINLIVNMEKTSKIYN